MDKLCEYDLISLEVAGWVVGLNQTRAMMLYKNTSHGTSHIILLDKNGTAALIFIRPWIHKVTSVDEINKILQSAPTHLISSINDELNPYKASEDLHKHHLKLHGICYKTAPPSFSETQLKKSLSINARLRYFMLFGDDFKNHSIKYIVNKYLKYILLIEFTH